jgi:hypothetical protein
VRGIIGAESRTAGAVPGTLSLAVFPEEPSFGRANAVESEVGLRRIVVMTRDSCKLPRWPLAKRPGRPTTACPPRSECVGRAPRRDRSRGPSRNTSHRGFRGQGFPGI